MELIPFLNIEKFEALLTTSTIPIGVLFFSDKCPACKSMQKKVNVIMSEYKNQLSFFRVLRRKNKSFSDRFQVKSVPSLIFFKDGKEVGRRIIGDSPKNDIIEILKSFTDITPFSYQPKEVSCDLLIIGGGPAGLSAAIYSAREGLKTILLEESLSGGKLLVTQNISNYPGSKGIITGASLANNMIKQAKLFGAEIKPLNSLNEIFLSDNGKWVLSDNNLFSPKAVIIATGAEPSHLMVDGEKEFLGSGVHYCAICDGPLYKNKDVLVIGGGNSALKEAVFLSRYCKSVTIIHQFDYFQASKVLQDEIKKNKKIRCIFNSHVSKIMGKSSLSNVLVKNTISGEISEMTANGVFVYIGTTPRTSFLKGQLSLDSSNYIITSENMETSVKGVFAAGDVRSKSVRQVATAVSDGVIAALSAYEYINHL